MSKDIEEPGELTQSKTYNFAFKQLGLIYESYEGTTFSIQYNFQWIFSYILRVSIIRKVFSNKSFIDKRFLVFNPTAKPLINPNIVFEVGLKDKLRIQYDLFKTKYEISDCIVGRLNILESIYKIKSIEVHLIKKEIIKNGKFF